jgi:hypothetical protein
MYLSPHHDDPPPYQSHSLPQSFYDHVSTIIKLFRKQLTLFIKLSQSFIEESELVTEMIKKKDEAINAIKEYSGILVD